MATQRVYNATTKQYVDIDVTIVPDEDATLEDRKKDFRLNRNILLKDTDWALASDTPLSNEQKTDKKSSIKKPRLSKKTADKTKGKK